MIDLREIDWLIKPYRDERDLLPKLNWRERGQLAERILGILDNYTQIEFDAYVYARSNLGYHSAFSDIFVRDTYDCI